MPWTREKLEAEWIGAPIDALSDRAATALSAFECVEKRLGADWLATRHLQGTGIVPTLGIVFLGECLAAIENLQGFELLVEKVRSDDFSALSEMEAVRMFRLMGGVEIELAPDGAWVRQQRARGHDMGVQSVQLLHHIGFHR